MLTITNLTYRIAGRTLIDDATVQIPAGHRVGLLGRNGTGKSTLFNLIMGELHADGGEIQRPSGSRIGIVAQEAPGGSITPVEVVLAADRERAELMEKAESEEDPDTLSAIHMRLIDIDAHSAPARAAIILAGLGFDETMQNQPMSSFSGGWRMRVALAAALFAEPDILLLDEPTNHLDLEATVWLEAYLKSYAHTLLMISHDRHILNSVVDHILHLDQTKLTLYSGGYDQFQQMRAARIEQTRQMAEKQEERRKHLQSFVDRFRAKATKARQAQSRLKMLSRLTPIALIAEDSTLTFNFPEPPKLSPPLLSVDEVTVGYGDKAILRGLDLRLDPEDRVALLGANGNGKSTLAKLLAGRLQPMTGRVTRSNRLEIGFFAQHQVEEMEADATPLLLMSRLMPKAREMEVRARLARFGFGQEKIFTRIEALSGGERARLNLALVTHAAPALLIFDEPTNHLDIDSREALAEALNAFPGAVVLISHDWFLLEMTADRLWLVGDGKAEAFDGDLEDYRRLMLSNRMGRGGTRARDAGDGRGGKNEGKKGGSAKASKKSLEPLRRKTKDAELAMQRLAALKKEVEGELGAAKLSSNMRTELMRRQKDLTERLARAEAEWLAAEEELLAATPA